MARRYCYIVQGTEVDIVGVWSARDEAIAEAIDHITDSGVTAYEIKHINDDFISIVAKEGDMLENAKVLRYEIR